MDGSTPLSYFTTQRAHIFFTGQLPLEVTVGRTSPKKLLTDVFFELSYFHREWPKRDHIQLRQVLRALDQLPQFSQNRDPYFTLAVQLHNVAVKVFDTLVSAKRGPEASSMRSFAFLTQFFMRHMDEKEKFLSQLLESPVKERLSWEGQEEQVATEVPKSTSLEERKRRLMLMQPSKRKDQLIEEIAVACIQAGACRWALPLVEQMRPTSRKLMLLSSMAQSLQWQGRFLDVPYVTSVLHR